MRARSDGRYFQLHHDWLRGLLEVKVEQARPSHADFDALEEKLLRSLGASLDVCERAQELPSPSFGESAYNEDFVAVPGDSPTRARATGGYVLPPRMSGEESGYLDDYDDDGPPGRMSVEGSGYLDDDDDDVLPTDAIEDREPFVGAPNEGEGVQEQDPVHMNDDLPNIKAIDPDRCQNLRALYRERDAVCRSIDGIMMGVIMDPAAKLEQKMDWREPMMCVHFTAQDRVKLSHGLANTIKQYVSQPCPSLAPSSFSAARAWHRIEQTALT